MARIAIVYGTRQGQTARIVNSITATLEAAGNEVDAFNLKDSRADALDGYDAAIVAASVHVGSYEPEVRRWVHRHCAELAARPNAFVSVSLSAANSDAASIAEMDAVIDKFRAKTGWTPDRVIRFAGALVYSKYNWLVKRMMRNIVRKKENGQYTDMTRDYDLTNFAAVRDFAFDFGDALRTTSSTERAARHAG
jgi:menaquinone-dependent protoporphyrinogen oxidase